MSDDADLEAGVRLGSHTLLAIYVNRQRPRLLAHINHRLGTDLRRRIDAEDVLQEMLVTAFSQMRMTDLKDRDLFRLWPGITGRRSDRPGETSRSRRRPAFCPEPALTSEICSPPA